MAVTLNLYLELHLNLNQGGAMIMSRQIWTFQNSFMAHQLVIEFDMDVVLLIV